MHDTARFLAPARAALRGRATRRHRSGGGAAIHHPLRQFVALCVALAAAPGALSAPPDANGNGDRRVLQEIYAGVVSNHTISFTGQEFYRAFVAAWRDRDLTDRYNISVKERPSAR